jgi:hypothetical protein
VFNFRARRADALSVRTVRAMLKCPAEHDRIDGLICFFCGTPIKTLIPAVRRLAKNGKDLEKKAAIQILERFA